MPNMRIYAALGALLGWFALALQLYLMLVQAPAAPLQTVVTFLSFFTILTNTLVALVFTAVALRSRAAWGRFLQRPSVQGGATVYVAVVAIIYQLLLRKLWNPQGAQWLADLLLHVLLPAGYILFWWLFAPRDGLRWRTAFDWLAYPAVYLVYILGRGAVAGVYPYPFVDVHQLGFAGVLARSALLMLFLLALGLIAVAITRSRQTVSPGPALPVNPA